MKQDEWKRKETERRDRFKKIQDESHKRLMRKKDSDPEETHEPEPEEENIYSGTSTPTSMAIYVVVVTIMIIIGGVVYGYVRDAMIEPAYSFASNATLSEIEGTFEVRELMSLSVIILAAVAILGFVFILRDVAI